MSFLALGLNHRTAPLELRERLAVEKEQLPRQLARLQSGAGQGVILSTCNRLEVYTAGDDPARLAARLEYFLTEYSGAPWLSLQPHFYRLEDAQCVRHLFRVASGLDSMIVGEHQILGQVRTAFSAAAEAGAARGFLSRLFHQALRAGRRVHRETGIGKNARSVSQAAAQLARSLLGDLAQQRVLVIGAGDAGRLVARALQDAGARRLMVTNRTHWRAVDLAERLGGVAAPFEDLPQELAAADVVISSTGAPGYVLERRDVAEAMSLRPELPLLLIDIAVPRDIDPESDGVFNVRRYDIDALQLVAETDAPGLAASLTQAETIIEEETTAFLQWRDSMGAIPLVATLRQRAEQIRQEEVERSLKQFPADYPPDLAERLEALTTSLVNKLLHDPTMFIKEGQHPARQQVARQMFNLDEERCRRGRRA